MNTVPFIILQVIVFGGLLFFLRKLLYGDTQSAVNRLEHVYQDMLGKQKELAQKIEDAEKEYNEKKAEAEKINAKLKNEMLEEAHKKEEEIVKTARAEAAEVIEKARMSVDRTRKEIEKQVRSKLIDECIELLKLTFSKELAQVVHRQLIADFLSQGKTFDLSGVGSDVNKVKVKSAEALSKDDKEAIQKMLFEKMKRQIELEEIIEPPLLGGILIQFDTLLLDGSLNSHLKEASLNMKKKIESEG